MSTNPSPWPLMVDAQLLAIALSKNPSAHPDLVRSFERARRAISCAVDLEHAQDNCDALARLEPVAEHKQQFDDTIRQALMFSALSLYTRATLTNGTQGERGPSSISYDSPYDDMHKEIVDIRNMVLAHVYIGREVGGHEWHSARVVLVQDEDEWSPLSLAASSDYSPEAIETLRKLLPIATAQIKQRVEERQNIAMDRLRQSYPAGETFNFDEIKFDLAEFVGGEEAAQRFWSDRTT